MLTGLLSLQLYLRMAMANIMYPYFLNLQEILRLFQYLIMLSVLIMPLTVCMLMIKVIQVPTINIIVKAIKNLQKSSAGFPV